MISRFATTIRQFSHQKGVHYILLILFLFSTHATKAYAIPVTLTVTCDPSPIHFGPPPSAEAISERMILTGTVGFYTKDATGSYVQLTSPIEITPLGHEMSSITKVLLSAPQDSSVYIDFELALMDPLSGETVLPWIYATTPQCYWDFYGPYSLGILTPKLESAGGLYAGQWDLVGYWDVTGPSSSPVPEPASFLLVGVGVAGLGAVTWRRRLHS